MSETFKPTESMAANAKRAIKWKEEGKANGAGTSIGWTRAGQLARRESLTLDTVKRMYSFFSRHEVDKQGKDWEKPSHGKVMWYAWGGDSGYSWSRAIVNRMNKEVQKDLVINMIDDLMELTKDIGTSSSANEERDERSVENYVRQSANTNTNSEIGGSIVSNTTEPDPKGDIAVQKSFPTGGEKLISQETRPTDGATSVSDAPNNPGIVPNQETIPSSATSAIAPSKTDEVNTPETVTKADAGKCPHCGQAMPVEKADEPKDADEITKAANCADCGKEMSLCDCMGKSVDEKESKEEAAKETPADEAKEMKKSLWGGKFAPIK